MSGRTLTAAFVTLLAVASAVVPKPKGSRTNLVTEGVKPRRPVALVQQHLTVCNAYHGAAPLEIFHVDRHVMLTQHKPLKYKQCAEYTLPLMEGDRLDFKSAGVNIGVFHATAMPKSSSYLLLVPRRKDGARTMSFESHAFADLKSPQIAVVDAYHGNQSSSVNIIENMEEVGAGQLPLVESLRFNSVVAVSPGKYNIALMDANSDGNLTAVPLRAGSRAKCVVMRVGGESQQGSAFPQELVIFPNAATTMRLAIHLWMVLSALVFKY